MDYHDFPHLLAIASGYLGQDWRSWGDSFEGVVALYKSETTQEERAELLEEIDLFEKNTRPIWMMNLLTGMVTISIRHYADLRQLLFLRRFVNY
jgi:hypothetical protein